MATQEQVNALQADLLAAEAAYKAAAQAIVDAASAEGGVTTAHFHKLVSGQTVAKAGMKLFHDAALVASGDVGITPNSGGGPKDDD